MVSYAETWQLAGRWVAAVNTLHGTWHAWQQDHPGRDRHTLRVVMSLIVMLAVCGRTRDALHQLAAAGPAPPPDPAADLAYVWLPYPPQIAARRAAHRADCTWTATTRETDIDWKEALRR